MAFRNGIEVHDSSRALLLLGASLRVVLTHLESRAIGIILTIILSFLSERLKNTGDFTLSLISEFAHFGCIFLLTETSSDLLFLHSQTLPVSITVGTSETSTSGLHYRLAHLHYLAQYFISLFLPDDVLLFTVKSVGIAL